MNSRGGILTRLVGPSPSVDEEVGPNAMNAGNNPPSLEQTTGGLGQFDALMAVGLDHGRMT